MIDNWAQWFVVVPGAINLVQGPSNYEALLRMGVPHDQVNGSVRAVDHIWGCLVQRVPRVYGPRAMPVSVVLVERRVVSWSFLMRSPRVLSFVSRFVPPPGQVRLAGHWVPKGIHSTIEQDCR